MTQLGSEKEPEAVAVIIFKITEEQDPYQIIKSVKNHNRMRKKVYEIDNEIYHYISIEPSFTWAPMKQKLAEDSEYEYMFCKTFKKL